MTTSTISVVIPTFHRYDALGDTVHDLMRQTVPPKEIIVVDNTTLAERRKPDYLVSTPFTQCMYVSSRCEGRVNVARNEGLVRATSDYVVLFDDDMQLAEDLMEKFLTVHSEGWDAVTGVIIEGGRILDTPEMGGRPLWSVLRHRHGFSRGHTIAVPSCFVSMRTEMVRNIGPLDEAFIYNYDDYDLGFRIWKSGHTLVHDPRVSAHHLKLAQGGSRKNLVGHKRRLNKYTAKYYFLSKHFNKRAARAEFLTDLVLVLWDGRVHPLAAAQKALLIVRAFRQSPAYAGQCSTR
jgi:GT2 family glycosyltransferase